MGDSSNMRSLHTARKLRWMNWAVLLVVLWIGSTDLFARDQLSTGNEINIPVYGWLGIEMGEVGGESTGTTETGEGVEVLGVIPDGPAQAAGLQKGDVIVSLNNQLLLGVMDFLNQLRGKAPGQEVTLLIKRNHKFLNVPVTLVKMPVDKSAILYAFTIEKEGTVALEKGDFSIALEKYKLVLELSEKYSNDPWEIGIAHSNLGVTYSAMKEQSTAVVHYSKAAQNFHLAKDFEGAILIMKVVGAIQHDSGKYREAVETLNSVLDSLATFDQAKGETDQDRQIFVHQNRLSTLAILASAYSGLGEVIAQHRTCEIMVTEFTELFRNANERNTWTLSGGEHNNLGFCFSVVGEGEKALRQFDLAIQKFQSGDNGTDHSNGEAYAWEQKAFIYYDWARYEEAIEYFQLAALNYHNGSSPLKEAEMLVLIGKVYGQLSQFPRAKEHLHSALMIYENEGVEIKQADTLWSLGEMSGWPQGQTYYNRAQGILWKEVEWKPPDFSNPNFKKSLKQFITSERGADENLLKELPEDIKNNFLAIRKVLPQKTSEEVTLILKISTSMAYHFLIRYPKQLELIEPDIAEGILRWVILGLKANLEVLQEMPKVREFRNQGYENHFLLGLAYLKIQQLTSALQQFRLAETMEEQNRGLSAAFLDSKLASSYASIGYRKKALMHHQRGLTNFESLEIQSSFAVSESKIVTFDRYVASFKSFVPFLIQLSLQQKDTQYLYEAFDTAERLKARIFLEELAKSRGSPYLPEEKAIRAEGNQLQRQIGRLHRLLQTPNLTKTSETELFQELAVLRQQWDSLQEQAKAKNPRYTSLVSPTSPTVKEVQGELDDKTVVLDYITTEDGTTIVFAITKDQFQALQLPTPFQHLVLEYLQTLQQPLVGPEEVAQHVALGQTLYRQLLGPVEQMLTGKQNLIIIPDSSLYYLPFEALIHPEGFSPPRQSTDLTAVHYLLNDYQVTYFPSVSVMMTQRQFSSPNRELAPFPLLVVGDAIYQDPDRPNSIPAKNIDIGELALRGFILQPLKYSGVEARGIATIWGVPLTSPHVNLRERASVNRLRDLDLSRYRLLHFATHAIMDDEITLVREPALVLSQTSPDRLSSLLKFSDILDLRLNADLVVLSACNTRLGKLHEGEGIVGMTRAFMYAGADSVVVSLWNVEDQSTSLLMQRFHQRLKNGATKAEALRQAKLDLLHETVELEATGLRQSLASPFFWAPFVLIGDWD